MASGSPYRGPLERILLMLAGAGIVLTSHLALWYGDTVIDDPVCTGASDCASVIAEDPTLFGISSATSGLFFYVLVFALGVGIAWDWGQQRKTLKLGRLLLVGAGFLYSTFLTILQLFALDDFCLLCLASFFLVTSMAVCLILIQGKQGRGTIGPHRDIRFFASVGVVVLIGALADYAYFQNKVPDVGEAAPMDLSYNPALCSYDYDLPTFENLDQFISDSDPSTGPATAPVTVMEFIDPNCPACKNQHPVMVQLAERYPNEVRIVYKPVAIMGGSLLFSLDEAMALWLADEQGVFPQMIAEVFEQQNPSGLSVSALADIAGDLGLDRGDFRRALEERRLEPRARQTARVFDGMGLTGVPAILINGRKVHGADRSLGCLSSLVDEALASGGL